MDTSQVYDPRDGSQDPDDPDTWVFSKNQALITLDAVRNNPVASWSDAQIDMPSFIDGADIADEAVALRRGGTEARYEISGTVTWSDSTIQGQIEPLARAGAGRLINIGGKLGYAPGAWTSPVYTVTDALAGQVLEFENMKMSRDIPKRMRGSYTSSRTGYETADLPPITIDDGGGAEAATEVSLIDSETRARRVQKIEAARVAAQTSLVIEAPASACHLVSWSNVTVDLPGLTEMDGTMRVVTADPTIHITEGNAKMRVPLALQGHTEDMYDWSVADEVETFFNVETDVSIAGEITITGCAPKSDDIARVAIYRGATGAAFTAAVLIGSSTATDNADTFEVTASSVTTGEADFWAVPMDEDDALIGTPSGPYTLTIT
jgi:hypothetical protein